MFFQSPIFFKKMPLPHLFYISPYTLKSVVSLFLATRNIRCLESWWSFWLNVSAELSSGYASPMA